MRNRYFIAIIAIVILIAALIGVIYFFNDKDEQIKEFTYIKPLNFQEFKTKYDNGEEFYVYIGRPDCGDSRQFEKEFINYFVEFDKEGNFAQLKYQLEEKPFYYFDISEIIETTSSYDARNQYKVYGFYYTPSLVHYRDGQVVNIAEWDPIFGFTVTDYMQWFYETGLITPNDAVYHEGPTDRE